MTIPGIPAGGNPFRGIGGLQALQGGQEGEDNPVVAKIKELLEKILGAGCQSCGQHGAQPSPSGQASSPQAVQGPGASQGGGGAQTDPAILEELLRQLRKIADNPQALNQAIPPGSPAAQFVQAALSSGFSGGGATAGQ